MLDYGAVTTPAGMPFNIRLERIYDGVSELMEKYNPEAMSIEKLFYNNNAKRLSMSARRGESSFSPRRSTVSRFRVYAPAGQTERRRLRTRRKKQVQEMTRIILNLEKIPKPDDAADALAMAVCHCHCSGSVMGRLSQYR